jgi:hypothetical protein
MDVDDGSTFTEQHWSIESAWPKPGTNYIKVRAVLTLTLVSPSYGYNYKVDLSSTGYGPSPDASYHYAVYIVHKNGLVHRLYLTGIDSCSQGGIYLGNNKFDYVQLQHL